MTAPTLDFDAMRPPLLDAPDGLAAQLHVLSDLSLLRAITSFQGGLSMALHELWQEHLSAPRPTRITPTLVGLFLKSAINVLTPYHLQLTRASLIFVKGRWRVPSIGSAVRAFVENRRVDLLEWMIANGVRLPHNKPGSLWKVAVQNSDMVILERLQVHCPITQAQAQASLPDVVTANASIPLLEWISVNIQGLQLPVHFTHQLAADGNLDALRIVLDHQLVRAGQENAFHVACISGHCDVLDYLLQRGDHPRLPILVDEAGTWKGLHALRFLHERGIAIATTKAMDRAVRYRRWDIVQFLHTNRTEGGTASATDWAVEAGDLSCVKMDKFHY